VDFDPVEACAPALGAAGDEHQWAGTSRHLQPMSRSSATDGCIHARRLRESSWVRVRRPSAGAWGTGGHAARSPWTRANAAPRFRAAVSRCC
jgi:hypothetical protein